MKKEQHFFLVLLVFVFSSLCRAQSFVTIDGSQAQCNFRFTNTAGESSKDYSALNSGVFSVGFRAIKKGLLIRVNVGPRKGGAIYNQTSNNISWTLNYFDLRAGAGYELNKWRLKPYLSLAAYYSTLMKGMQQMDGLNYDLKKTNELNSSDYGILVIPGLRLFVSDLLSLYCEFSYLHGLQNLEKDPNQKLFNSGYFLTLGMAFNITKSKPQWLQGK